MHFMRTARFGCAKTRKAAASRRFAAVRCEDCGAAFELRERRFACPACGSHALRFQGGHGMTMTGLDVTAEDEPGTPAAANEDKHD